ncbi:MULTISPECIES: YcaO-like family protein [Bacillaceae]|uniref:YcaO domain-containing protein n=1 Tax=Alkalicoccobacillus plakortidis TaxID=444060 RepID=A0A9D5I233_9BACI|nr:MULTISPECIES: YcaO-like family protein [Bacillaceae]KQL58304.1 hypothetical protein AN965_04395 [Alkalicoccobacillus plakortidis]
MNRITLALNRDHFQSHHSNIFILKNEKVDVKSYECVLPYAINNIVSTLGEFFEREVLVNSNSISTKDLNAVSLIDGRVHQVPSGQVVFEDQFVDSCGMSSHYQSSYTIKSSFLEFLERQSLLFNYLSQSLGTQLIIKTKSPVFENYQKYLFNYIDELKFFNISMVDDVYVILAIGYGNKNKVVGMGTGSNVIKAAVKALQEMLQYFAVEFSKYTNKESSEQLPKDKYHADFDSLTPEELKKLYSYLEGSPVSIIRDEVDETKEEIVNIQDLSNQLNRQYGINPLIVAIPSKRMNEHLKVTKVLDLNWFPHMNPSKYKEDIYLYIENATNCSLNRELNFIPFP